MRSYVLVAAGAALLWAGAGCQNPVVDACDLATPSLRVVNVTPAAGTVNVWPSTPMMLTFATPIDEATIEGNILLTFSTGEVVTTTVKYMPEVNTIKLTPGGPLLAKTWYVLKVKKELKDSSGNGMPGDFSFDPGFETAATQ
jgi:hypothetical protein